MLDYIVIVDYKDGDISIAKVNTKEEATELLKHISNASKIYESVKGYDTLYREVK